MSTSTANPTRRLWLAGITVLVVAAGAWAVSRLARDPDPGLPPPPAAPPALSSAEVERHVHQFCGGACHEYPPADSFPRKYWRAEVERGFRFFEQSGLALDPPRVEDVVRYYEAKAPEELAPADLPPASPSPVKFERTSYPPPKDGPRAAVSNVSLARLPRPGEPASAKGPLDVLVCDMGGGRVMSIRPGDANPQWQLLGRVPHPAHAIVVDLDGDGIQDIVVADLGSFPPTDRRCGSVVWLRGGPDGTYTPHTLLKDVGRVADVQAADFRGTGKLDLIVGVFGLHAAGEVILLENHTTDWEKPNFVRQPVDNRHGAIHVPVADLNGDGKPDFVALFAQEHETVVAFINDGHGGFKKETLYRAPHPGWGSSGIELVDLNGDGKLDVLYSNGDILDEPYLLKPYHTVQWLENKGHLKFEHHMIAPMYGVHRAVAGDFRGTGVKDVAAVSFLPSDKFPDRVTRKADSVVLYEQTAPGTFARHPLSSIDCDWCTCVAGDVFGTGRTDLVVGNFSSVTNDHPITVWKNSGK